MNGQRSVLLVVNLTLERRGASKYDTNNTINGNQPCAQERQNKGRILP